MAGFHELLVDVHSSFPSAGFSYAGRDRPAMR
jgi:hypothetical protein